MAPLVARSIYRALLCRPVRTDVFALVECLRDLASEHSIHGAREDEQHRVEEGDGVRGIHVRVAHKHVVGA